MNDDYGRLIDKLDKAENVRSTIIQRFLVRLNASDDIDANDEINREWDAADQAVSTARESIRNYLRFRRPR